MNRVERTVGSLAGEELSAVSFVRDYVEFHFDGPVLRALTNPRIEIDGETTSFPEPGSRDRLCALIGRTVRQVDARERVHIRLAFQGGATVTLPFGRGQSRRSRGGPFSGPSDGARAGLGLIVGSSNIAVDRTAGSHSLAAAGHRGRSAAGETRGRLA